jgi:hypothetical protein
MGHSDIGHFSLGNESTSALIGVLHFGHLGERSISFDFTSNA